MRAALLGVAVALGFLLPSCSMSLVDEDSAMDGALPCSSDTDCSGGAHCDDGVCVGGSTSFDEVLLEVIVPSTPTAGAYSGTRYLRTVTGLGAGGALDLDLPALSAVELSILPPPCADAEGQPVARVNGACPAGSSPPPGATCDRYDFGQVPLEVTLTPAARALGLVTERYTALSACGADGCGSARFSLTVPPDTYDVYVRPDPTAPAAEGGVCAVVPEIFAAEAPADVRFSLDFELSEPSVLATEIQWPLATNDGAALEGWTVDMLEPDSARRISTQVVLGAPVLDGVSARYTAELAYVTPPALVQPGTELVRLQPPDGVIGPTVVMERSALELFSGPALIDQLTALPEAVEVEAQILARTSPDDPDRLQPLGGSVTFVATELEVVPAGVLASFRRSLEVVPADGGVFRTKLLPGKYRVRVVPPGDCSDVVPCPASEITCVCPLAATEIEDFVVGTQAFQAGKAVELGFHAGVTGTVTSPNGTAVVDAEVQAVSVPVRPTALELALGDELFVPRVAAAKTEGDGTFELGADAGLYNFAVRPAVETALPWLVRPNVSVPESDVLVALGELVVPLPVSFAGVVRVSGGADGASAVVPNAILRAFVRVDSADPASRVIQVGEVRADEAGAFELMMPTALEHAR